MITRDLALPRGGTVMPLAALCLVVLLGFVALTVDLGYLSVAESAVQISADAGALAGASALNERVSSADVETHATDAAKELIGMNRVLNKNVTDDAVIEVGYWEGITHTFTRGAAGRSIRPNAVRVVAFRDGITLYFAHIMGVDISEVHREAVATGGSGGCRGVWGIEGITTDGDITTDSYNSRYGLYGEDTIYPNGDLCSCRNIVMNGSYEVNGDVMYGRGYGCIDHSISGKVWGVISDHSCGKITTEKSFSLAEFANDNGSIGLAASGDDPFVRKSSWDLRLSRDDSIVLSGGTYFFDSIRLTGQATIRVAGPTVITVKGPADFGGSGIVNLSGNPADLLIYSEGSMLNVNVSAGFFGAIYAPETDVKLTGSGNYHGTIVGRTLVIDGNIGIHVDESLVKDLFGLEPAHSVLVR